MAVFTLTPRVQVAPQAWTPARGQPKLDFGQVLREKTPCSDCGENIKEYFLPRKDSLTREGDLPADPNDPKQLDSDAPCRDCSLASQT